MSLGVFVKRVLFDTLPASPNRQIDHRASAQAREDVEECNIMALLLDSAVMGSPGYVRFASDLCFTGFGRSRGPSGHRRSDNSAAHFGGRPQDARPSR